MGSKANILMEKYEFGRLLGQGNFAKVYYGRRLADGQSVAIKVIDKEKIFKFNLIEQTKREISIMGLVKHPNILQIYEVMATKTKIYFVLEYAKGGELFNKLTRGRLKEDIARKYFQQLIMAVDFCHSRGVYHRDLKPENLLLDENKNLKVSDFGLSALSECKRQDGLFHTTCGTPAYVAPEVISRKGYDGAKADIWSCGVVLFVLVAGFLPFHGSNVIELYRKISRADYKCPQWFPSEVRRLLLRILDPNPDTRISMAEIMDDPWFKKELDCRQRNSTTTSSSSSSMVKGREKDLSTDSLFCPKESSSNSSTEDKLDLMKPTNFNAFDIISLSTGFDLSGLFVSNGDKEEVKFTSRNSASSIVSKFEEVSRSLGMKVMKKDGGVMKLEAVNESKNGTHLCIDVEIFEIAISIYLVEIRRSSGDTVDYLKLLKEDLKPALSDIVWAWQGKEEQILY